MNPNFKTQAELAREQDERIQEGLCPFEGRVADPQCKVCHGRGFVGRNMLNDLYVPCRCVKKVEKENV